MGKGHPAGGNLEQLALWFLAETASFRERDTAAKANTVCLHTQEQTVCMTEAGKGWEQLERT